MAFRDEAVVRLLEPHLREFRNRQIDFRVSDCVRFAGGWLKIAEDFDPVPNGIEWHDEASATRAMAACGFKTAIDAADSCLPRRPLLTARTGDIVAAKAQVGYTLGICTGSRCEFLAVRGTVRVPLTACTHAWGVL